MPPVSLQGYHLTSGFGGTTLRMYNTLPASKMHPYALLAA